MIFIREEITDLPGYDYYIENGWSFLVYKTLANGEHEKKPYARFYGMRVGDFGFYAHFDILEGEHTANDVAAAILCGMRSMEEEEPPLIFTKTKTTNTKILRLCKILGFHVVNIEYKECDGTPWITLCKEYTRSKNEKAV